MKKILLLVVVVFCFITSCKKSIAKISKKKGYSYYKKFSKGGRLIYDNKTGIIFHKYHYSNNQPNKINYLELRSDSLHIKTGEIESVSFFKDILKVKDEFIILNTHPRTLGKNLKSTDFLTKYNKEFQVLLKKDMDISKYPSGSSLIIGDDDRIFYITDGHVVHKPNQKPKLIISEIDDSFNILNQKKVERKTKNAFRCDPMKAVFIKDVGLVIVSRLMFYDGKKSTYTFKIEMFDLNLNIKWSEDLDINAITSLEYSNSKELIALVTEKEGNKISFLDFNGNKKENDYNISSDLISITSNDDYIYLLENKGENRLITKIDFLGRVIKEIPVSRKKEITKQDSNELLYREHQLFLIDIDNSKKSLTVHKIE